MSDETTSNAESGHFHFSIQESEVGPLLSCLLHSKFNGDVRLEFLTSPLLNNLIREILLWGRGRGLSSQWFLKDYPFKIPPEEMANKHSIFNRIEKQIKKLLPAGERDSALSEAFYPYFMEREP
jgi:hypothetical protein